MWLVSIFVICSLFLSQSLYYFISYFACCSLRWSLGAIMYEMLVGYPPFYSDEPMSTCRKVRMGICSLVYAWVKRFSVWNPLVVICAHSDLWSCYSYVSYFFVRLPTFGLCWKVQVFWCFNQLVFWFGAQMSDLLLIIRTEKILLMEIQ